MREYAGQIILAVEGIIKSICENGETAAAGVIARRDEIRRPAEEALRQQSERIAVPKRQHLKLLQLEMELELLENLRCIYTLAKRVATDFIPKKVSGHA